MKLLLALLLATLSVTFGQNIDLTGYTLTFEDNFDTLSVDNARGSKGANTWHCRPPTGSAGNYSASLWDYHHVNVSNGLLSLESVIWAPTGTWYSGQISSMDDTGAGFAQKYGYFSARVRMPNAGTGAWPAFWLLSTNAIPNNQGQRMELDVFEWYGKDNNVAGGQKVQQVLHLWEPDNTDRANLNFGTIPGGDPVNNWHIYGILVKPDTITWYIDGMQTFQLPTPTDRMNNPFFIMLDYGLGGGWPLSGEPFASHISSEMLVDWVRVYALPAAPVPTPTPQTQWNVTGTVTQTPNGWQINLVK